jgi:hypothetical protein
MEINRVIDDLEPSPPWLKVLYHKLEKDLDHLRQVEGAFGWSTTSQRRIWIAYYKSEEDLDCLLQVGEAPTSIYQMVPILADYSNFINNAVPSPNGHHGLMALQSWYGGLGYLKGMSPPSYPAQPTLLTP